MVAEIDQFNYLLVNRQSLIFDIGPLHLRAVWKVMFVDGRLAASGLLSISCLPKKVPV